MAARGRTLSRSPMRNWKESPQRSAWTSGPSGQSRRQGYHGHSPEERRRPREVTGRRATPSLHFLSSRRRLERVSGLLRPIGWRNHGFVVLPCSEANLPLDLVWDGEGPRAVLIVTSVFITILVFGAVLMRYIFDYPGMEVEEIATLVAFWLYFTGAIYGAYERSTLRPTGSPHLEAAEPVCRAKSAASLITLVLACIMAYGATRFSSGASRRERARRVPDAHGLRAKQHLRRRRLYVLLLPCGVGGQRPSGSRPGARHHAPRAA